MKMCLQMIEENLPKKEIILTQSNICK